MALKLFNTLSRSLEEFVPIEPAAASASAFIAAGRPFMITRTSAISRTCVFGDLVRRYLQFKGFDKSVTSRNITDVEDKIIQRVNDTNGALRDYTAKYETAFFQDFDALTLPSPASDSPRRNHIADIIALIEKLAARGIAYWAADGSVYFSIEKYQSCRRKLRPVAQIELRRDATWTEGLPAMIMPRTPSLILRYGRRACRRMARFSGPARGARAVPGGTSSAAQ